MKSMTSRERVMKTLEHQEPDQVPMNLSITLAAYTKLVKYLGLESKVDPEPGITCWTTTVPIDQKVMKVLNLDIVQLGSNPPSGYPKELSDGTNIDEWGVKRRRIERPGGGFYLETMENPLKKFTLKDLDNYPWPNPYDPSVIAGLEKRVRWWFDNTDYAIQVSLDRFAGGEQAGCLRGLEQFWSDLVLDPEFAMGLINKLFDLSIEYHKICLELVGKYANIVRLFGWDLGGQNGPLFSPSMIHQMVKPALEHHWTSIKKLLHRVNPKAKICFHSCGSVYKLIPTFIECGLDILDPIQVTAAEMDTGRIKREFGDNLVFHGGIDIQKVLPFGTVDQVRDEVKLRIKQLAPGGGYIFAPTHNIQDDVPPENILAMYRAGKEYGKYPISI